MSVHDHHRPNDYDAIIIGARCAGASTALLLARHDRRVLVLDRATFPSDVLSGHTIQPTGMARLARWGLLDKIRATGVPFANRVRFDFGDVVLDGSPTPCDGIDTTVCVRRTIIDPLLAHEARAAGAEVRLGATVTELARDGERVLGVRGHDSDGRPIDARARLVIGADGANSFLARRVGAEATRIAPVTTVTVYSYWEGLDLDHLELAARPGAFFVAAPTNDGLAYVCQQVPLSQAGTYRGRIDDAFAETMTAAPHLAELLSRGRRVERFRFARTPDGFLRRSHGPGWALVGDAGCHMDPITAQGMLNAFRDAESLADAIHGALDGTANELDVALARYEGERDAGVLPMFEHTATIADLETPPPAEMGALLEVLQDDPVGTARFLGVTAGSVTVPEFFDPSHLGPLVGAAA